jgi:hypothetical protein
MMLQRKKSEQGQAMAETALFSVLIVLMAFGFLSLIPIHRARTAATAAAYGCAQFLSQSPDPVRAAQNAQRIANDTLSSAWSGTFGVQYSVRIEAPSAPGEPGACQVNWQIPELFRLGFGSGHSVERFVSRSETWKAKWR